MNKKLFAKVKDLCKDTGLSEKYLNVITEKMGGSVEDDSTDDAAIEATANLISELAKESQSEATRWVNAKKKDPDPDPNKKDPDPNKKDPDTTNGDSEMEKRLKAMEEKMSGYEAKESKAKRTAAVMAAMDKHKIPTEFRDRLAKSISDDEDIEEAVTSLKQGFITAGLSPEGAEGSKAASEKEIEESADSLLESITVK